MKTETALTTTLNPDRWGGTGFSGGGLSPPLNLKSPNYDSAKKQSCKWETYDLNMAMDIYQKWQSVQNQKAVPNLHLIA